MAAGWHTHPVFSIPLTLMFVHHDHFTQVCEKLYISQASVSWEWSVNGISELQISLASRTSFNVSIYICKNVFLIKIRKWKAAWEQNLPTGFLWQLTRSDEVWNWPTFKKPPKLQKRKWNSEIWSECKLRKVLVIDEFVLDVWLFDPFLTCVMAHCGYHVEGVPCVCWLHVKI